MHLGGLGRDDDRDIGQRVQLVLQHGVGAQLAVELDQRHMGDDAGEVDGRLDAGIAAADHRHALALEQRAVAMRAIGHALVAIFGLAGHVHLPPARAGGEHDRCAPTGSAPLASRTCGEAARLRAPGSVRRRSAGS